MAAVTVREDKLAESAPKQPLALTLGAAAVTLAVIIGVLAGPSVVNCFNADENMGVCLRGKMTEAGILPGQSAALADPAAATPEATPVTAEPSADIGEPALDVAEPGAATPADTDTDPAPAVPENLIAATFGLLRAEPDGSVVIAGSGTPGSEIEVYANDTLLGRTTVESSGDWVLVPDQPIPTGGAEITLGEAGKTGRSEQSFVVAIADDKTSQPLVVASTPGAASDILQGLERPAAGTTTQMAAADPVAPAATTPAPVTATPAPSVDATAPTPVEQPAEAAPVAADNNLADTSEPVAESADAAQPAAETTVETPSAEPVAAPASGTETPVPEAPAVAATQAAPPAAAPMTPAEPTTPSAPVTPATDTPTAAEQTAAADTAPATEQTAAPDAETTTPVTAPADIAVAAVEPTTVVPPAVTLAGAPPTIDAIELDGARTFFAGGGPEGATMRLYVDDQLIADTKVADGRWLVEAGDVLKQPSQRVRIDMLQPGTAKVASRAEVNFVIDLPTDAPAVVVASQPEPASPAPDQAEAPTSDQASVATPADKPLEVASAPEQAPVAPAPTPAATAPAVPATAPIAPPVEPAQNAEPASPASAATSLATPATAVPAPTADTPTASPAEPAQPTETAQTAEPAEPATNAAPIADAPAAQQVIESAAAEPTTTAPAVAPASDAPAVSVAAPEAAITSNEPEIAVAATTAEPEVPTMVAVSVGNPNAQRFASGKAIIRRGDNLWTIARRVYGEGIKYTTIYQANTGQIRDPDRIYPGQVFELPEGLAN